MNTLYRQPNTHIAVVLCSRHVRGSDVERGGYTDRSPSEEPCSECRRIAAERAAMERLAKARAVARQMIEKLLGYEIDATRPSDGRRIISDERQALHASLRLENPDAILARVREAKRALATWERVAS